MRFKCVLLAALLVACQTSSAQFTALPEDVRSVLDSVGPVWAEDISGNIRKSVLAFTPILKNAPKDGVKVERNLSYGAHPLQSFDVYRTDDTSNAPIVVFVHGGAYVGGSRNSTAEISANIPTYFARHGMVGVNIDYRLAPEAVWPAAAEDVGSLVQWLHDNGRDYGGDPEQIYLIGSSAGATHIATYTYDEELHPPSGHGLAGVILMSGRYHISSSPNDPNLAKVRAYFGENPDEYERMSVINQVENGPLIPTYIVIAEFDNPGLDVSGAELFAALCRRDRRCPKFTRLRHHNHLSMNYSFNSPDKRLSRSVLDFIRMGR
ncbi:MAG: alpha/beta hydrolase [Woeseiaceae bacterium]|nr:alpha/beta hydrolase [Woeseiaceae bacterium]